LLFIEPFFSYLFFFSVQVALVASSLLAFVLNYSIFWNTAVNSALTQTVSGQAKGKTKWIHIKYENNI
jgi:hypothetical protein